MVFEVSSRMFYYVYVRIKPSAKRRHVTLIRVKFFILWNISVLRIWIHYSSIHILVLVSTVILANFQSTVSRLFRYNRKTNLPARRRNKNVFVMHSYMWCLEYLSYLIAGSFFFSSSLLWISERISLLFLYMLILLGPSYMVLLLI